MIQDMWTIIRKDIREIVFNRGTMRSGLLSILVVIGLIGVYLPLQTGPEWLTNPISMVSWAWLPVFLVVSVVTDAIAGERERHTLETLLASRLSDRAILLGKIGAAVLYGWGMSMIGVLLGVVTVNIAHSEEGLLFYQPGLFLGMVVFSLLVALLMSTIGVFVSLHAPTARVAYQRMSFVMLGLFLAPTILVQVLPAENVAAVGAFLRNINLPLAAGVGGAVLVIADIVLITLALARFQRTRLILD